MKPAQIAGLSVAAAATFIIAIALMALSVFLRRRRERKNGMHLDEKNSQSPSPRSYSARFSQYFAQDSLPRDPPKQFLIVPPPPTAKQMDTQPTDLNSIHPLLRPGAGPSNNSSDSSVPLDQIGLAISAELPETTSSKIISPKQNPRKTGSRQQRPKSLRHDPDMAQRPDSVLTQSTVFEEDDIADRRRESRLLPTPPYPIPPIRSFQPSRPPPTVNVAAMSAKGLATRRQAPRHPELFLDIPVRHSRSEPKRVPPTKNSPPAPPTFAAQPRTQPGPRVHITSALDEKQSKSNPTSTAEAGNGVDIDDYYFTAHQEPTSKYLTPTASPSRLLRPKESPKVVKIKPKKSSSTVSRSASRASTNLRDSVSSQTSFETVDPNDPTPEDEEDEKQLAEDSKLSPVAESPISNLRYPKVPRASNQLVPRSPRSPQSQRSQESPRGLPEPSGFLFNQRSDRDLLESQVHTGSPHTADVRKHMRQYRQHLRSTSLETWNSNSMSNSYRSSDRTTRVLSGQWPKSPAMYDPNVVKPLSIRTRHYHQPSVEMQDLKSPAWVPRLYPTRQGDDLLISVTYSKPGQ
ncbi:hypothetical protein BU26DRAFT_422727 [Trematosphaeria pertusa]|uniref:Uncharacterized protein n=1 Tax=Trematosphaeria pertusa TaxID=390896 RepID=A0A6A6IPS2_9PLEO|nr:uncharacterized protein BU26DRAFT_422727 [Trematosphaeria pertusa]KAF2252257.1 hypothetical protein BU26DRAFT_422727 [Trematosphaeria pertusa]